MWPFYLPMMLLKKGFQQKLKGLSPLVLIAGLGHCLAMKNKIQIQDLNGETIILPKHDCGYKMVFEKMLVEQNIKTASKMDFNSVEAVKRCVMKGIGISIIPRLSVRDEINAGMLAVLPLTDEILETCVLMIRHKNKWLSPTPTEFMNCARKTIRV